MFFTGSTKPEDKPKPSTNTDNKPQATAAAPGNNINFRKEPFKIVQILGSMI